ncbi:MAG: metalloregulator ArsR/SmtB family transcription factor [Thermodesulfobacteriota bacterium]
MSQDAPSPRPGPAAEENPEHAELAALCKALGHPARVRIVERLAGVDGCVCGRIVERLPLAQSTVSQHLKVLKEAGLVRGAVEGPRTCYCLDRERLARLADLTGRLAAGGKNNPDIGSCDEGA